MKINVDSFFPIPIKSPESCSFFLFIPPGFINPNLYFYARYQQVSKTQTKNQSSRFQFILHINIRLTIQISTCCQSQLDDHISVYPSITNLDFPTIIPPPFPDSTPSGLFLYDLTHMTLICFRISVHMIFQLGIFFLHLMQVSSNPHRQIHVSNRPRNLL